MLTGSGVVGGQGTPGVWGGSRQHPGGTQPYPQDVVSHRGMLRRLLRHPHPGDAAPGAASAPPPEHPSAPGAGRRRSHRRCHRAAPSTGGPTVLLRGSAAPSTGVMPEPHARGRTPHPTGPRSGGAGGTGRGRDGSERRARRRAGGPKAGGRGGRHRHRGVGRSGARTHPGAAGDGARRTADRKSVV